MFFAGIVSRHVIQHYVCRGCMHLCSCLVIDEHGVLPESDIEFVVVIMSSTLHLTAGA